MEIISILLLIVAVVCAIYSEQIDTAVKGDKKVKKVIVIFNMGVLLVCEIAIMANILW
ncbi:MAG: protein CrcB-like protein [Oscillibacter sp.]|nr:protein CrcB-like protein [Oscillibacter sp.]